MIDRIEIEKRTTTASFILFIRPILLSCPIAHVVSEVLLWFTLSVR